LGIVGQSRGNLQADEAIPAFAFVVDAAENIGRGLNVADGDFLVKALGVELPRLR